MFICFAMFEYPVFAILLEPWVARENKNVTIKVQNESFDQELSLLLKSDAQLDRAGVA